MMLDTFLVQRLSQPPRSEWHAKATRAFGGNMLGLTPEQWKLLQSVFEIEYMGSAEYEFGALPRSLEQLFNDRAELEAFELIVPRKVIRPNPTRQTREQIARRKEIVEAKAAGRPVPRKKRPKKDERPDDATVFVLCRASHKDEVPARIFGLAGDKIFTKGANHVARALDPIDEYDRKICGWYELSNGFFFFTDRVMWERTVSLFRGSDDP